MAAVDNTTNHQYCSKCGEKLVFDRDEQEGYNTMTGKENPPYSIYKCPNKTKTSWSHDAIEVQPFDEFYEIHA